MSWILKEELILWQSLSSPTRTFNAVKIGGIQGSYYQLAGKKLASCQLLGKRCQRYKTIANQPQSGALSAKWPWTWLAYLRKLKAANSLLKMG